VAAEAIANIAMLGCDEQLTWSQDENGLTIQMPSEKPCEHAYSFRIVLKGSS